MFSALEISRSHSLNIQASGLGKYICKTSWNCFADCYGVYPMFLSEIVGKDLFRPLFSPAKSGRFPGVSKE